EGQGPRSCLGGPCDRRRRGAWRACAVPADDDGGTLLPVVRVPADRARDGPRSRAGDDGVHQRLPGQRRGDGARDRGVTAAAMAANASVVTKLSTLDRYLPVWILAAMLLGVGLGRAFPDLGATLDRVQMAGVSVPIAIGLLW